MRKSLLLHFGIVVFAALLLAGCPDNAPGDSGPKDLSGNITISPSASVTTGMLLTANYSGSEAVTYQWKKGGAVVSGTAGNKYTPAEAGSYTVTVSAAGYNSKTSAAVTVTGASLPDLPGAVTISPSGNVITGTELTANYSGTVTVTYQWNKDSAPLSGVTGNKYTPTTVGSYSVIVSATGYKSKTSAVVIVEAPPTPGLAFTLIKGGTAYSVSRGTVIDTEVVIPALYNGLPVTAIADNGFSSYTNMTSITIPNSVTSIGQSAFSGCTSLTSITIPFVGASLNGTSNTHFGYIFGAASGINQYSSIPVSLKTVIITGGNSIDNYAFYNCDYLMSFTIPNSVTSIGQDAFYNCDGLTSVTFQGMIASANFSNRSSLPGDLRFKYLSIGFGIGTYTRQRGSGKWYKTTPMIIEMVYVSGGSFQMGKELGTAGFGDITPVHTVTLTGFYIGKYPVIHAQYETVMGSNPSFFIGREVNLPVEQVDWYNAIEFCNTLSIQEGLSPYYTIDKVNKDPNNTSDSDTKKWTVMRNSTANGYRLPTEAQWEYAAKGGNGTPGNYTYSGSNTADDVAWYGIPYGKTTTHEVGEKQPNGLGIYDMSGNVDEWCWDWYGSYSSDAQTDPAGAASGGYRVLRGGSCVGDAWHTYSVVRRSDIPPYGWDRYIGFRLVRPQ